MFKDLIFLTRIISLLLKFTAISILSILFLLRSDLMAQESRSIITEENQSRLEAIWVVKDAHLHGITSLVFYQSSGGDEQLLSSSFGSYDHIKYWSVGINEPLTILDQEHIGDVTSLSISSHQNNLVSSSVDGTAILWEIENDSIKMIKQFKGHSWWVLDVAFTYNGNQIITISADASAILWNVSSAADVHTFSGSTNAVFTIVTHPNELTAITGGCGVYTSTDEDLQCILGSIQELDLESGNAVREINTSEGHTGIVYSLAFNQTADKLLSGSADNSMILWDVTSGDILQRFPSNACIEDNACPKHVNDVFSVALSNDGQLAISGSTDGTVILWDVETGIALQQIDVEAEFEVGGIIRSVVLNEDNTLLAIGTYGRGIIVMAIVTE